MHCSARTPVIGRRSIVRNKKDNAATGWALCVRSHLLDLSLSDAVFRCSNKSTALDPTNYAIVFGVMTEIQSRKGNWRTIVDRLAEQGLLIRKQFHEFAAHVNSKVPSGEPNPMQGYLYVVAAIVFDVLRLILTSSDLCRKHDAFKSLSMPPAFAPFSSASSKRYVYWCFCECKCKCERLISMAYSTSKTSKTSTGASRTEVIGIDRCVSWCSR